MRPLYESILDPDFDAGLSDITMAEYKLVDAFFRYAQGKTVKNLWQEKCSVFVKDMDKWRREFNRAADKLFAVRKHHKAEIVNTPQWPTSTTQLFQDVRDGKVGIMYLEDHDKLWFDLHLLYKTKDRIWAPTYKDYYIGVSKADEDHSAIAIPYPIFYRNTRDIEEKSDIRNFAGPNPCKYVVSAEVLDKFEDRFNAR